MAHALFAVGAGGGENEGEGVAAGPAGLGDDFADEGGEVRGAFGFGLGVREHQFEAAIDAVFIADAVVV